MNESNKWKIETKWIKVLGGHKWFIFLFWFRVRDLPLYAELSVRRVRVIGEPQVHCIYQRGACILSIDFPLVFSTRLPTEPSYWPRQRFPRVLQIFSPFPDARRWVSCRLSTHSQTKVCDWRGVEKVESIRKRNGWNLFLQRTQLVVVLNHVVHHGIETVENATSINDRIIQCTNRARKSVNPVR